jgi:hypothetical protein
MPDNNKPLAWIGSSKKDLMALPLDVRKFFGHALDFAQRGDKHDGPSCSRGLVALACSNWWKATRAAPTAPCTR